MRWRIVVGLLMALMVIGPALDAHLIERVSVSAEGGDADGISWRPALNADGRLVAFTSIATNLIEGGWTDTMDVYLRNLSTGQTRVVSVTPDGGPADGGSGEAALSADGRYVAFTSGAGNLVGNDTNGHSDIFVHDRTSGETRLVSVASDGTPADHDSSIPSLSADGRLIAFQSYADNLVTGDTDQRLDGFVHDTSTGETICVSVGMNGLPVGGGGPCLSANGRFVAFQSYDGGIVPNDTNNVSDIFIYDLETGDISRVSLSSDDRQANGASQRPAISADGRWVVFDSAAANLCPGDTNGKSDVFVRDRESGKTRRVSIDSWGRQGLDTSRSGRICDDGRFVVFLSKATNLFPEDSYHEQFNVVLHDSATGATRLVNHNGHDQAGNDGCFDAAVAADGSLVAFSSRASDLVPDDGAWLEDVFASDTCPRAAWHNYGEGWPGTHGVPILALGDDPLPCQQVTLALENSLGSPTTAVLLFGLHWTERETSMGGTLLVEPQAAWPLLLAATGLVWPVMIPCSDLCNACVYLQALELDPGARGGVSFTPGLELTLGH